MSPLFGGFFWAVVLVLVTVSFHEAQCSHANDDQHLVPLMDQEKVEIMVVNETRRKLGSFQICSLCTCCVGGSRSFCIATPCCYSINCNLPNRPFGFCSFSPQTCNCFGCHI